MRKKILTPKKKIAVSKVHHRIEISLQSVVLPKTTKNTVVAYKGNSRLGELTLGQGTVTWKGANKQDVSSKTFTWTKFAEMLNLLAYNGGRVTCE